MAHALPSGGFSIATALVTEASPTQLPITPQAQADAEPVAEHVAHEPRFAVDYLKRALDAIRDALAAAVTFILIYLYYFSLGHYRDPLF